MIDLKGDILHTNPAASELLGVAEDELIDDPISSFWGEQDVAVLVQNNERTPFEEEAEIITKEGRVVPVGVRSCRIDYLGREAIYLLLRDITESRRARKEILEANRKLKELDRLKSDFLNTVSHELRTPLTSIRWSTESLAGLNKNWDEATFNKLLRIIGDDNQRLTKLIEQLLSFSRLDAGQLAPKFETFDLTELAEKAILNMSPTGEAKEIDLTWVETERASIVADREQIRLIITNLLDNAIKYSPAGSRVIVTVERQEEMVQISILDSGIGITEDDIDHIFDRFYRANMAEVRDETGTGLGLAVVSGILDAHKGSINVKSKVGEGREFKVHIPIATADN